MAFARPGYILCCGARACRRVSTDEVEGAAGFFVNRGPVLGGSAGGWGFGIGGMRGWRERSQFGGSGLGGEGVEVVPEVAFGLTAATAQFGVGAVPGAFEGGDLALHAGEEFGGGGIGEQCGGERRAARFGEDGAVEVGLDEPDAALLPGGAEHGFDVEFFGGGCGAEIAVVGAGEGVIFCISQDT